MTLSRCARSFVGLHFLRRLPILLLLIVARGTVGAHAATPFVAQTADGSANQVGLYSSLALDGFGDPHVAYHDATAIKLKYAHRSGSAWIVEVADAASLVGEFCSIALDAQGNPHISYQDAMTTDVKYARRIGGAWIIETADATANNAGYWTAIALDAQGNPHVTYRDITAGAVRYARRTGGAWTVEAIAGTVAGEYTSIALDQRGAVHVCYSDGGASDVVYARKAGGVWVVEIADGSGPSSVGQYSSLAIDAQLNPHLSYWDLVNNDLKYARKSGGSWATEIVDQSANDVGRFTSIEMDGLGNPHVSYSDFTNGNLKYAKKSGGLWSVETADNAPEDVGRYTSLALDAQGNPHVSYFDNTSKDLVYAHAAIRVVSPLGGVTWPVGSRQQVAWSGFGTVSILLSSDGGNRYETLLDPVDRSPAVLLVPHVPTRFARVKIVRASPPSFSFSDSLFTIDATITLTKFDASPVAGGVRLTWATEPGPEASIRYRVSRADGNAGAFLPTHAGLLDDSEFLDTGSVRAARYRLAAVNGLGGEYVVGETSSSPPLASDRDILVYPNPSSGPMVILFRVPVERDLELAVYDASGRRVRALASGRFPVATRTATWDQRDEIGRSVAAGTYFVRLTIVSEHEIRERAIVLR